MACASVAIRICIAVPSLAYEQSGDWGDWNANGWQAGLRRHGSRRRMGRVTCLHRAPIHTTAPTRAAPPAVITTA